MERYKNANGQTLADCLQRADKAFTRMSVIRRLERIFDKKLPLSDCKRALTALQRLDN
jgi:hypothetical protein